MWSVWNNGTRSYDYYEAPGTRGIHAGAPPRASTSALGATPDEAAWPLPHGARKVGNGEVPRGRIASLGGYDASSSLELPKLAAIAVIGYLVWKAMR